MTQGLLQVVKRRSARLTQGRAVLSAAVLTRDLVCTGQRLEFSAALRRNDLSIVWRRGPEYLQPQIVAADVIVAWSLGGPSEGWSREGDTLWSRAAASRLRSASDRVIEAVGQSLSEVDLVTGATVKTFACPKGTPVAKCGSIVVLKSAENGDPVLGLDIETGTVRWERQLFAELRSLGIDEQYPVLLAVGAGQGRIVFARGGNLVAIGADDGEVLWRASVSVPYGAAHVIQGRVCAWSAGVTVRRTTFDMTDGVIMHDESAPVDGNALVLLEEATGAVVLRRALSEFGMEFQRSHEVNPGAVGRRHIAFTTRSGLLAVFRFSDGELVLKEQFPDQLSRPAVDGKEIFVTCSTGRLEVIECAEEV